MNFTPYLCDSRSFSREKRRIEWEECLSRWKERQIEGEERRTRLKQRRTKLNECINRLEECINRSKVCRTLRKECVTPWDECQTRWEECRDRYKERREEIKFLQRKEWLTQLKAVKFLIKAFEAYMSGKSNDLAISDTAPKGGLQMRRLKKCLPMFLNGLRYDTTPDTGSQENAISADEARRRGLKIFGRGRHFMMANGSRIISLGIVRLKCAFALGERCMTRQLFHVIDSLAVPVIIGKTFLDVSKTMTLHRHRLESVSNSTKKTFRVMHLNRPKQLIRCYVNGKLVHANPDTGSEVDLISPSYARENLLEIESLGEDEDCVQFADGSIAKLLGKTCVDLDIYDGRYRSPTGYIGHSRTFYLLDGLTTDVLLGEEALFNMHVFTEHEDSFVYSDDCGFIIEMNLITWFDKRTRQMSDTLALLSSAQSKPSKSTL